MLNIKSLYVSRKTYYDRRPEVYFVPYFKAFLPLNRGVILSLLFSTSNFKHLNIFFCIFCPKNNSYERPKKMTLRATQIFKGALKTHKTVISAII